MFEIGPVQIGEVQLGIGQLPQQEIADPPLAPGTDAQIRQREGRGAESPFQCADIDVAGLDQAVGHIPGQRACCLGDIPLATVVGRYQQLHAGAAVGAGLGISHGGAQFGAAAAAIADDLQPDVVVPQLAHFPAQGRQEPLHQGTDLILGPGPVFAGEGEQGKYLHPLAGTHLDDRANGVDAGLVTRHAGHEALARPAVVAIHDDGNVAGDGAVIGFLVSHDRSAFRMDGGHQIAIRSASLASSALSISAMYLSVSICSLSAPRRSSLSLISFSSCRSWSWSRASRRMLRTATGSFSASVWACWLLLLWVSSVRAGMCTRMAVPAVSGFRP